MNFAQKLFTNRGNMKYLIAGLGNIGPEYALTRHNVGFMALDRLAVQQGFSFKMERLAYTAEFKLCN